MNEGVVKVRDVLADLIRAALVSDDRKSLGYREAARAGLRTLTEAPPDPASVRVDGAWTLAIQAAETRDILPDAGRINLTLPRQSPFALDDLLAPGFDADEAVERIRKAASTG